MKNLITPNIDAALLEEGYVRPNEAALWVKKRKDEEYPYKIVFDIGDCLLCMENWYSKGIVSRERIDESVRNTANTSAATTFSTEKDLFAKILMLTADFYYHIHTIETQELEKKYINLFEKFTGLKWK